MRFLFVSTAAANFLSQNGGANLAVLGGGLFGWGEWKWINITSQKQKRILLSELVELKRRILWDISTSTTIVTKGLLFLPRLLLALHSWCYETDRQWIGVRAWETDVHWSSSICVVQYVSMPAGRYESLYWYFIKFWLILFGSSKE